METKIIEFSGIPGKCVVPVCTEEDRHEFGLFDEDGKQVMTSMFCSMDYAVQRAKEEFPDEDYTVRDLTEEWYISTAIRYRRRIKIIHPSFKLTKLVLDMSRMYYSRQPNDWYTCIPFEYGGNSWVYRETASEGWVHRT